jgi:hypothetical protein
VQPVLKQREIRRDTVRMLRAVVADTNLLVDVAEGLPTFRWTSRCSSPP